MQRTRAIKKTVARRACWTLAYVIGVFLLVGAVAYVEWRWETQWWTKRVTSRDSVARAARRPAPWLRRRDYRDDR